MKIQCISIKIAITSFLAIYCLNYSLAQTSIDVSGDITVNTTWDYDLVRVTGDISLKRDASLTIAPGTRIEFHGHYQMEVLGQLIAEGNEGSLIEFICRSDLIATGWAGLRILDYHPDTSVINYCRFRYAINSNMGSAGAIYVQTPKLKILNSIFTGNEGHSAGAIVIKNHANVLIRGNSFYNNQGSYAGAVYCHDSDPIISNNTFVNESQGFHCEGGEPIIQNNLFGACTYYAIYCNGSHPRIIGNIICNNNRAINCTYSNPIIANNTICNNTRGIRCGTASRPKFYNTMQC